MNTKPNRPLDRLRHHVTGAIERGEAQAIVEQKPPGQSVQFTPGPWRLRGPQGQFVGLDGLRCAFVPEHEALTFDGRDNEATKLGIYQATLGPLRIELLSSPA